MPMPNDLILYTGPLWRNDGYDRQETYINVSNAMLYLEEYCPYEPSSYVHEPLWIVWSPEWEALFDPEFWEVLEQGTFLWVPAYAVEDSKLLQRDWRARGRFHRD